MIASDVRFQSVAVFILTGEIEGTLLPFTGRQYWKGGSIRKLNRLVDGVMAAREKGEARQ